MTKLETILLITMGIVYLVNFIGIIEIKRKLDYNSKLGPLIIISLTLIPISITILTIIVVKRNK